MKKNGLSILSIFLCLSVFILWNCSGPKPTSPTNLATVSVAIPISGGSDDALTATNDTIEYVVTGPGMSAISGSTTISSSSVVAGTVNFSVNVQAGPQRLLAVEMKNTQSNQPLDLGAIQFDLSSNASSASQIVELGSLTRDCYFVNNPASAGETQTIITGSFSFASDVLSPTFQYGPGPPSWDIQFYPDGTTGFYLNDSYTGGTADIAYMGNGDLVNFAYVPNTVFFKSRSDFSKTAVVNPAAATPTIQISILGASKAKDLASPDAALELTPTPTVANSTNSDLAVGDVYCIQPPSIPGGYAWIQIINVGVPGVSGPSFIFRANSTVPYFAFQRTGIDTGPSSPCNGN
jgi:hypothetical protein